MDDNMAFWNNGRQSTFATTRSSHSSMIDLLSDFNVHSNIFSQSINYPYLQFNTLQSLSTPTRPTLLISKLICGSFIGNSIIRAQQKRIRYARPDSEDALRYVDQVKFKFANRPQVYYDFLKVFNELKSGKIGPSGVIIRVSNLFKNRPELILGFNKFLPRGHQIEIKRHPMGFLVTLSKHKFSRITPYCRRMH